MRENAISGVKVIKAGIMVFSPALPALAILGDEQILAILAVSIDPRWPRQVGQWKIKFLDLML